MAATKRSQRYISVFLFIAYLAVLCYFLFFAESMGRTAGQNYHYNLTPFHEIFRYLQYADRISRIYWLINLFGNVAAFIPMGYFLPRVSRTKNKAPVVIFYCFTYSLLIETVQLFTRLGCFDVDDILLNTLGGALGFWICWLIHGRRRKKKYGTYK